MSPRRTRKQRARTPSSCEIIRARDVELAMEALIRMEMSQLVAYQSISRETRFKQDIKDGRAVSSLVLVTPPHQVEGARAWVLRGEKKERPT